MVYCEQSRDDAFDVSARSVGCTTMFLSQKLRLSNHVKAWYASHKTISNTKKGGHSPSIIESISSSESASARAGHPPFVLPSNGAPGKEGEKIRTPILCAEEAWDLLGRRFQNAQRITFDRITFDRIALESDIPEACIGSPSTPILAKLLVREPGCDWVACV